MNWWPRQEMWTWAGAGDQAANWGPWRKLRARAEAADQSRSWGPDHFHGCHKQTAVPPPLRHSNEGILHIAEGSFRAEETGRKKEGNIASPRQRMSKSARVVFYHVRRKPGNQMGRSLGGQL